MDPVSPTSFIQKRALTTAERPRASPFGLLTVISVMVLLLSLVFFGGTYFYKKLTYDEINRPCPAESNDQNPRSCGLKATVEKAKQSLNQATIIELQRLDRKFKIANEVLASHNTILPLFALLEELTLPTVRFTNFSYTDKGVSLTGESTSYEDIAVQTQIFSKDLTRVSSFVFSDLNQSTDGRVTFKLTLVPVAELQSYEKFLIANQVSTTP